MRSCLRRASVVCLIAAFAAAAGESPPAAATHPGPGAPAGWIRLVEEEHPAANALVEKELDKVLPRIDFAGTGFGDVIQFVRDASNVSMHPRWDALRAAKVDDKTPVTMHLRNVMPLTVLRTALDDG